MVAASATYDVDAEFYLREYPDVQHTGLDPSTHFEWLGARLGRRSKPQQPTGVGAGADLLDVLFVDGSAGSISCDYRIRRVAEGLRNKGGRVECIGLDEVENARPGDFQARYVTFFRAPLRGAFRAFASAMRSSGAKIVFDIDDLVFEEELIPVIDGYRCLPPSKKRAYVESVRSYRDFVAIADFCTVPTNYLAGRIRAIGQKAHRIRNTLDYAAIERFRTLNIPAARDQFVVGYYSGTKTHQADFRRTAPALVRFMEENPSVSFRLVGHFDLSEYPGLQRFSEPKTGHPRLISVPAMPHDEMLADQLRCDVVIAPLEVGNPFCESKSELKFFEAALVGRPVIAAATATFRDATRNGDLAMLADTSDEWLAALRRSFSHRDKSRAMAMKAQAYVQDEYSPANAGADAYAAYVDLSAVDGSFPKEGHAGN